MAAASYELVIVLPKPRRCCEKGQRISEWVLFPPIDPTVGNSLLSGRSEKFLANPPPSSFLLFGPDRDREIIDLEAGEGRRFFPVINSPLPSFAKGRKEARNVGIETVLLFLLPSSSFERPFRATKPFKRDTTGLNGAGQILLGVCRLEP